MLRDEEGLEAPLPQDQSLYYLQQILEGVNFLHQSGYLHLDIKGRVSDRLSTTIYSQMRYLLDSVTKSSTVCIL